MAKLSDRILGERLSGFVTKPNILDNSNFQVRQRGDSDTTGNGGTYIDRWNTRNVTGSGGTTTISVPTLNSGGIGYDVLSATVAGHTSFWTIQQFFKVGRLKSGSDYTFTFKTNLMANPIKLKAKLRGRDVSAGAWAELGEGDVEVDSYGTYSVTFLNVTSSLPLNAEEDFIVVQLTGFEADNGSDFVLPDGTYQFDWFKLEEGNVYTGYEPTPYAQDELECMKWYQIPFDGVGIAPFYANIYRSAGSAGTQDHVMNVQLRPKMYSSPALVDAVYVGGVSPDSIKTNTNSMRLVWLNTAASTAQVGVDNLVLSCEL